MDKALPVKTNRPLHWFAVLTAISTFLLLGAGGLVTSHEAGMSVPDWPNSFGYNMFLFPPSKWIGGIFYEHTHRLWASVVGMLTTALAIWIYFQETRRWMKWLGLAAFLGVVAQGVLGGLRVDLINPQLGIIHGILAQAFFALVCAMALFTSRFWHELVAQEKIVFVRRGLRSHVFFVTILIFLQLILGATMRHQHAGLAISDFPLAHGKIWPDISPNAIARYNAERMDVEVQNPITAFQIILQMIHRIVALLIFLGVASSAGLAIKRLGKSDTLTKLAFLWTALIIVQIGLGIETIWSNKAADIATAHVLVGALSLVTGVLWCLIAFARSAPVSATESPAIFGAQPSLAGSK